MSADYQECRVSIPEEALHKIMAYVADFKGITWEDNDLVPLVNPIDPVTLAESSAYTDYINQLCRFFDIMFEANPSYFEYRDAIVAFERAGLFRDIEPSFRQ